MSYLEEALELLEKVSGNPQTLAERERLSIELAALMLYEAGKGMTFSEKKLYQELSRLMSDPIGKVFASALTDECFRSDSHLRIANQMIHLMTYLGIPEYLSGFKKLKLFAFKCFGPRISQFLVPFATKALRKETERVILPGEQAELMKHLKMRKSEGVRQNINHLGEAILSESEAKKRLHLYLEDLKNPEIDYVSIKISTIYSQINLLAFEETVQKIGEKLQILYRAALKHQEPKFVNLDMEEYRDLDLTVAVFKQVLDESEFQSYPAGIVLQAYLPDAFAIQKQLTEWAIKRVQQGGAPIKIRIVKGGNLAMEQWEASLKGWPQAPYTTKVDVDANYKRMLMYGCYPEHARAVRLGIASHNLFDIAFAMLLRRENRVEPYTGFEMLEGMADHIRRVVQHLSWNMLLYCPVATKADFKHAVAYLIRRLDENTGMENWDLQTAIFSESCRLLDSVNHQPRRTQNRQIHPALHHSYEPFDNEPDTDFSLPQNRSWARHIANHWKVHKEPSIPLVVDGQELWDNEEGKAFDPNGGVKPLYTYMKADASHIERALESAKAEEKTWGKTSPQHRGELLAKVAQKLRERRGELLGSMLIDGAKILSEGDPEVSEAIDFTEYYRRQIEKMTQMKEIAWQARGTVVVISPWNFPCAIPIGGISAALAAGNCVLFKPSSHTILVGWHVARAFWDAGIPKKALQFLPCSGDGVANLLIEDERVNAIILTGGTATARKFLAMRPHLNLYAETGGKNAMIITALSERDLAIKDLIQSAFGNSGQKCSAASLAILEAEVYDDPFFLKSLKEAVASLTVGPSWDLSTKIGPLIFPPKEDLLRGLTTLEEGEVWLLEPQQDLDNPCLWSPGIKTIPPGGFTHMTELFGPVLGILRASNLDHAIELANRVPYGLTAGLHSLDDIEQNYWMEHIQAGNLYINRGTTGAVVRRQPFGGYKASSIGAGAKAGGPNYVQQFMIPTQTHIT